MIREWLRALLCGLRGHQGMKELGIGVVRLRCVHCGRVTRGWELGQGRPRRRFDGDPARFRRTG